MSKNAFFKYLWSHFKKKIAAVHTVSEFLFVGVFKGMCSLWGFLGLMVHSSHVFQIILLLLMVRYSCRRKLLLHYFLIQPTVNSGFHNSAKEVVYVLTVFYQFMHQPRNNLKNHKQTFIFITCLKKKNNPETPKKFFTVRLEN